VQDEGRGMAPALLSRVFEPFVQGRQDIDRQPGGLGLGLAIVRSLVELHGGRVAAASEGPGMGSRFDVWLPLADGAMLQPAPPLPAAPAAGTGRLLVVDDNADAAETLSELLRLAGYEVRSAGHASAALALLEEFEPQLALLDIGLPGIDGYQLAELVRAHPRGQGARLVALTGYGQDNDRAKALAARFDEHLVKPVAAERLFELIARLLP
jgi:CheY-like chemotaxis protein